LFSERPNKPRRSGNPGDWFVIMRFFMRKLVKSSCGPGGPGSNWKVMLTVTRNGDIYRVVLDDGWELDVRIVMPSL
jgi:hypothetical protein